VARRDLDGRPQEPVAENIHAAGRGGLVVALPIFFGRIGLAEIDGAVRKHGIGRALAAEGGSREGRGRGSKKGPSSMHTPRILSWRSVRSVAVRPESIEPFASSSMPPQCQADLSLVSRSWQLGPRRRPDVSVQSTQSVQLPPPHAPGSPIAFLPRGGTTPCF